MNRITTRKAAFAVAAMLIAAVAGSARAQEPAVIVPPPLVDEPSHAGTETAVFAGGCFWGVQGVFQHVKGVTNAVSGYAGGKKDKATYDTVSLGKTGHAESVQVSFNPTEVTYGQLLQVFFSVAHNPTQLNYQGPDHGTQYRSAIFTTNEEQKKVAEAYIAQISAAKVFPHPVVTKVSTLEGFYPAEKYHQDFLTLNQDYPYIVYNDLPKIDNLKRIFPGRFRTDPVLVSKAKS